MNAPPASALTGPSLLALVLLGVLAIAERVGLPGFWVQSFFIALLLLTVLVVLWLSRTTQERVFLGTLPALEPPGGAMVLAIVTTATVAGLASSSDGPQWLASLAGTPVGLLLAHGIARWKDHKQTASANSGGAAHNETLIVMRGIALLLIGASLALIALHQAQMEIARLLFLPTGTGVALASGLSLLAVLIGGMRACLMQVALLALATVIALVLLLGIGLVHLGPLPLPGLSETTTLTAIAEARGRWAITIPLQLSTWPDWIEAFQGEALKRFALSALIATGVALAISPALPIRRRSLTGLAVAGTIIIPLAVMAIAGYAIEAAASNFVGASIARPPAALVESARLGLISICGANPDSAEALRMACGVSPRDSVALAWNQISLSPSFLRSGVSAAFGYTATISMSIGILSLTWAMALATFGLALAAQGLGLHVLAWKYRAAGLASMRLGLIRLAALVLAVAFTVPAAIQAIIDWAVVLAGLHIGCGLLMAMTVWSAFKKSLSQSVPEKAPPPSRSRKRKTAALTDGETA